MSLLLSTRRSLLNYDPAFSPMDIDGLQLWLKSDAGLYQNTSGTTPALADTDPVALWRDQSRNSQDFQQGTGAKQPTLQTSAASGKPVVEFDGVDDILVNSTNFLGGTTGTVLAVYEHTTLQDSQVLISSGDEATDDYFWACRPYWASSFPYIAMQSKSVSVDAVYGDRLLAVDVPYVVYWRSNGSAWVIGNNKLQEVLSTAAGSNSGDWLGDIANRDNFAIGGNKRTSETQFFDGKVGELLVYDSEITGSDMLNLLLYLQYHNNTEPLRIGSITDSTNLNGAHDVYVRGDYAYVAGKFPKDSSGAPMAVVDVSDPENPVITDSITTFQDAQTVQPWDDDTAYLGDDGGIHVVDISDKYNISVSTTIGSGGTIVDVNGWERSGDTLIVASKDGYIHSIDMSTVTSPSLSGSRDARTTDSLQWPHDISIFGDYFMSISNFAENPSHIGVHVAVYRWADSGTPRAVGSWTLEDSITDSNYDHANRCRVDPVSSIGYVGNGVGVGTIKVVDASTPTAITTAATISNLDGNECNGLDLDLPRDRLYCGNAHSIEVFDISTRTSPVRVGYLIDTTAFPLYGAGKGDNSAHDLMRHDNHVYATAEDSDTLVIFSIPHEPGK